jgi:transposase-like protein
MNLRGELRDKGPNGDSTHQSNGRRRQWSPDEKFRIVVHSLTGDEPNIDICRRFSISEPTLYHWRQQFFEGGKVYLGTRNRRAVDRLKRENARLKEMLAELWIEYRKLEFGGRKGR